MSDPRAFALLPALFILASAAAIWGRPEHWTARTLIRDVRYLFAWWRFEHHRNPKGTR